MTINLKEIGGFFEDANKFTVLVPRDSVTETKSQLDFHNPKAKDNEVACWMGSMTENPVIPHAAIRYTSLPSNPECLPME